jgi:hypothetical protein
MTEYEQEIVHDIINNIYNVTNILDNVNSDFGLVIETSSHHAIIESCRLILMNVAEELFQKTSAKNDVKIENAIRVLTEIKHWYDTDGSVGSLCNVMDNVENVLNKSKGDNSCQ